MIPDSISVASENSVFTLATLSDSPQLLVINSDDTNHSHSMNKYDIYCGRLKMGYWSKKRDDKMLQKN